MAVSMIPQPSCLRVHTIQGFTTRTHDTKVIITQARRGKAELARRLTFRALPRTASSCQFQK